MSTSLPFYLFNHAITLQHRKKADKCIIMLSNYNNAKKLPTLRPRLGLQLCLYTAIINDHHYHLLSHIKKVWMLRQHKNKLHNCSTTAQADKEINSAMKKQHTCPVVQWRHLLPTNVGNHPHVCRPLTAACTSRRMHRTLTCRSVNKPHNFSLYKF